MIYTITQQGIQLHKNESLSTIQANLIDELVENGYLEIFDTCYLLDTASYFDLDSSALAILNLYNPLTYKIIIRPISQLGYDNFDIKVDLQHFYPFGASVAYSLLNNFIIEINGEKPYFLNKNQTELFNLIKAYKQKEKKDKYESFKLVAQLQKLSKIDENNIILTDYLSSQIIKFPEQIAIVPNEHKDYLILNPLIKDVSPDLFNKQMSTVSNIGNDDFWNYINENNQTERIVFDDKVKKALQLIVRHRVTNNDEKKDEIIHHPEHFFYDESIDEDIIDLSYYSNRVVELGFYRPRFYPFVSPFKSQWVPGFELKSPNNGSKKIIFKSEQELQQFEEIVNVGKAKGDQTIQYDEETITISDAENFIAVAKKQLKHDKEPLKEDINGNKVLIIHENADSLSYKTHFENKALKRTFTPIGNLKDPYQLKEYQIEGVSWLQTLVKHHLSGGLLADDMGLGKTLQILYFIEWHAQNINTDNKPYIIIAPVSLLENWENEMYKFFNKTLPLVPLYGSKAIGRRFDKSIIKQLQQKQVLLTNYETLRNCQLNLCAVDYACVILDEAQKIKTPGTLITNVAKAIKADFKIAMTGTPVENSLVDLWCIMDFAVPGLLGNAKDFTKQYQNKLKDSNTDVKALGVNLRQHISFYLTRRLKKDVINDLPIKTTYFPEQEMPDIQAKRYITEINNNTKDAPQLKSMLEVIHAIKLISDHPFLIDKKQSIDEYSIVDLINSSAKLQMTINILKDIQAKNEKVIIFTDRKETQRLLKYVIKGVFRLDVSIINGDTPSIASKIQKAILSRQQTIDRFEDTFGFNVIIMSPISAGYGLNVVGANHVIHYTRHWNPAKENQATDRVYRITQDKPVHIHHPIATLPKSLNLKIKSFDEVLNELLKYKNALASDTLFPSEQMEVTIEEMYGGLFSI